MSGPDELVCVEPTHEDAIAAAMIDLGGDGEILVHAEHCASADPAAACTCEPVLLVVRRGAA